MSESQLGIVQPAAADLAEEELAAVEKLQRGYSEMRGELGKVIVGQEAVIEELLIALFCKGHALLVGVPGLAKTLLISTLAKTLGLSFSRIQFTPDLMPSDITGTEVIEEDKTSGGRSIRFVRGPVFANVILADEINRTPPKTQAALLEAMQEHQVTAGGKQHRLPQPFFVLATQNPIEQEGTYPLPEAQLDRFMFNIMVGYPSEDEEFQIVRMTTQASKIDLKHVLSGDEVIALQEIVRKVPVADHVIRYALQFTRLTRKTEGGCPDFVNDYVGWGAGPRASQYLILAGKARALLKGRYHVSTEDIRQVALPVLRHRIVTNFNAEAEGIRSDTIVKKLIEFIPQQATGGDGPHGGEADAGYAGGVDNSIADNCGCVVGFRITFIFSSLTLAERPDIFAKQQLAPSQLQAVAERRFDDAQALCDTGQNARANGAQYLAGIVIEILLKAQLAHHYEAIASRPSHIVTDADRQIWNLIWRSHDLRDMLERLPGLRASILAKETSAGKPYTAWLGQYLQHVDNFCPLFNIHKYNG